MSRRSGSTALEIITEKALITPSDGGQGFEIYLSSCDEGVQFGYPFTSVRFSTHTSSGPLREGVQVVLSGKGSSRTPSRTARDWHRSFGKSGFSLRRLLDQASVVHQ